MEQITPDQVNELIEIALKSSKLIEDGLMQFDSQSFAKSYAQGYGTAISPMMQNQMMKSISLNPLKSTSEAIEKALENAKDNEDLLISYGQHFYLSNLLYKRAVDNLKNLNAWNLGIRCVNAKDKKDYKSAAFKKDYKIVKTFLAKFNYREQFNKITFLLLNNETYYGLFRKDMDESNFIFQDMPYKYCKTTARSTHGLQYDFDFSFFLNPMVNIDLYPRTIKKKFSKMLDSNGNFKYNSANTIGHRDASYALWNQLDAKVDGAYAFKMNADYIANVPYLAGMYAELALVPVFRSLELNQGLASAAKLVTSQWGMLNDGKTSRADSFEVNPTTMGAILGAVAGSLDKAIKVINLPSKKIDSIEFTNTSNDQYAKFTKNIAAMVGGGGASLFSTNKPTTVENNIALSIDENLMNSLYPQFEAFLNHQLSQITSKFIFKIKFSGSNTYLNREFRQKTAFSAGDKGVVSINKIANALDMDIFEMEDELDLTEGLGFAERLKPLLSAYNMSKDEAAKNNGAPQKSDSELSDSGQETRENGGNIGRGGTI